MYAFYPSPATLDEALRLKAELGDRARIMAELPDRGAALRQRRGGRAARLDRPAR